MHTPHMLGHSICTWIKTQFLCGRKPPALPHCVGSAMPLQTPGTYGVAVGAVVVVTATGSAVVVLDVVGVNPSGSAVVVLDVVVVKSTGSLPHKLCM